MEKEAAGEEGEEGGNGLASACPLLFYLLPEPSQRDHWQNEVGELVGEGE